MAILIAVFMFMLLVGIVSAFGYMHYVKPTRLLDQLATTTSDVIPSGLAERKPKTHFSVSQLLEPIGNLLPVSSQDALATKQELVAAGLRSRSAVAVYYGTKIVLTVGLVILALVFRGRVSNRILSLVLPVASGGLGYSIPGIVLGRLVKRRQEKI